MLEKYFRDRRVVVRLRGTVVGSVLDHLAAHLEARGHAAGTVRAYLRGAGHFAYWLGIRRISLDGIAEQTITRFLEHHVPRCCCRVPFGTPLSALRAALGHLLSVLRAGGLAPPPRFRAPTFIDEIIGEFEAHLRGACGAAQPTCRQYTRYVREFLEHRGVAARSALVRIDAPMLISFVSLRATRCKPGTAKLVATSLKSFLRFLGLKGVCDAGLVEAVPVVPRWKLASLPRVLTEEQLATLLQSFDRATAIGRRDYAMAQCLVQLGLRAAEVADLRLDDADWRRGTLRIAVGKSHRASVVPLPRQAGRAVVEYLRRGRPTTEDRHIFVQHVVPVGVQLNGAAVRSAIRRAFTRAGIAVPSKGTHALRHTAATRMLRAGASLKDLADVLRHRSLDTTLIYTKVDLPRLAAVALPWPEVHR